MEPIIPSTPPEIAATCTPISRVLDCHARQAEMDHRRNRSPLIGEEGDIVYAPPSTFTCRSSMATSGVPADVEHLSWANHIYDAKK